MPESPPDLIMVMPSIGNRVEIKAPSITPKIPPTK